MQGRKTEIPEMNRNLNGTLGERPSSDDMMQGM
jgi:hypothetical protein